METEVDARWRASRRVSGVDGVQRARASLNVVDLVDFVDFADFVDFVDCADLVDSPRAQPLHRPRRMPVLDRIGLGKSGEDLACGELQRLGYAIVARRYRTRYGEIDIVARDGPTVVFVEVKARTSDHYGEPAESVTLHKQARITAMAEDFIARRGLTGAPCRFDVVAVTFSAGGKLQVEVIKGAFDAVWR